MNMTTLLEFAREADARITALKAAFGAPGDWGYGHPQGDALFRLYQLQADLRAAIRATDAQASEAR